MCEGTGTRYAVRLRWRWLSAMGLGALAIAALISVVLPPSPFRTGAMLLVVGVAGWGALRWLAAHRAELDRADWCACAPATVSIRVIGAREATPPACRPVTERRDARRAPHPPLLPSTPDTRRRSDMSQ